MCILKKDQCFHIQNMSCNSHRMVSNKDEASESTISPIIFIYAGEGGKAVPRYVTHA